MINKEILKEYLAKYDEIKAEYALLQNVKSYLNLEKEKDSKEKENLHQELTVTKANLYHEKWNELSNMKEFSKTCYYQNLLDIIFAGLSMVLVGAIGGRFLGNTEFTLLFSGIVCPVFMVGSMINTKIKHKKEIKEIDNIDIKNVTSPDYEKLVQDYTLSEERNKEVEATLKIVNDRLAKLGLVKLDIENLILCLFSNLKNIRKNKSNGEMPFATWLDVTNLDTDPVLVMGPNLKKER